VAANRNALVSLVVSNLFGQNAPAIAAAECDYELMWAADVSAMAGYHSGASAVAARLAPWGESLQSALRGLPGVSGVTGLLGGGASPAAVLPGITFGNIGNFNLGWGNRGDWNLGSGNLATTTSATATSATATSATATSGTRISAAGTPATPTSAAEFR
jgi:PPE-repeat protein